MGAGAVARFGAWSSWFRFPSSLIFAYQAGMTDDRRGTPRYPAALAGEIETEAGRASVSITRDLSTTGLLVLSRSELVIGAPVKIKMMFRGNELMLHGKVVRREDVDPEIGTFWRFKVALAVEPSPIFDDLMAELAVKPPDAK